LCRAARLDFLGLPELRSARYLNRAGRWDAALEALPHSTTVHAVALRAEILVERHWWQQRGIDAAVEGVARLAEDDEALAGFLTAQIACARVLFDAAPLPGDTGRARDGFRISAQDPRLEPWALFWSGVAADLLGHDSEAAASWLSRALPASIRSADPLLESYVVRHQGLQRSETDPAAGLALLRRSLALRSALGATPQVAAAQAALAPLLGEDAEAAVLRDAVALAAEELDLVWLRI
jgi:hypothetical protein